MSFFHNLQSVWKSRRLGRQSGVTRPAQLEPLEVRMLLAGEFTDLGALGITGVAAGSVAWGDADNDGDLDILLSGINVSAGINSTGIAKVYRNNGDGSFTDLNAGLPGVLNSSAAWGDYDRDGDLDILLTGSTGQSTRISKVYQNNGDSTFTDINAGLIGVEGSSVAWGDADNDGDLDILFAGVNNSSYTSQIAGVYRNNGNGTFTGINAGLIGVADGEVAWGDCDNDGDLDILLTGFNTSLGPITKVYRNNGNSTFTDLNAGLTGMNSSSAAWGDYDNDGDLDIVLSGRSSGGYFNATIYRNNGNSTFTDLNAGLIGVTGSSVAWGDADNDGDLDILLTGSVPPYIASVFRNNGNDTFTDISAGLTGVFGGSVAWGDADNDGDVDILLTGFDDMLTPIARVYRNNAATANTPPAAPTGLTATVASSTSLTLNWTAATDMQTAANGLSYNLRVGTTPGGSEVFSTMANTINGTRRVAESGPIQGTSYTLKGLTFGRTYYWSVQAVDTAFAGSAFASEQTITLNHAPSIGGAIANQPVNDNATIDPFAALTVTDPDTQNMLAQVTILNGVNRGDLTAASTVGWTRIVSGSNIIYSRFYNPVANIGATVQTAIRTLVFQPRNNALSVGTTETTAFTVFVNDGINNTTNALTSVVATSSNDAPTIGGTLAGQAVSDTVTIAPFAALTVTDPDAQPMTASVTIVNGVVRGDFTALTTTSWSRSVSGNNIQYARTFNSAGNIGATVQAAIRALVFQPRSNAINPNTTETTGFSVTVSDGVASPVSNSTTSVITTSVNDAPTIGGASASGTVNDNATVNPFPTLTVSDLDNQEMLISVTILNGVVRGDFTNANAGTGWTVRQVLGNNITYKRYFSPQANVGAAVQAAFRALVFQPRNNVIEPGLTEATNFTVTISDGVAAPVSNNATTVITTSVNSAPLIGSPNPSVTVNDNATVTPFSTLTVSDTDYQEALASVTILNGVNRGDFTNATSSGWTVRYITGNNITYKRYFSPGNNVGATVQAAFRALIFQPRSNAIKPTTTEATDFQVTVSDGVAPAVANQQTRVTTASVNDVPAIGGAVANQTMNDNQTQAVFSTLTVSDPDTQDQFVRITITSGITKGDFTSASTAGWTRKSSGADILYERFFAAAANNGAVVQAAIRALVFQLRNNDPIGMTETTSFTVFVNDGLANVTDSTTSVITTGVAPRSTSPSLLVPPTILDGDITTIVMSNARKMSTNPLARLLKKSR